MPAPSLRLLSLAATLSTLPAQRPEPAFEYQKRTTSIAYGQVPLGKHSLDEMTVGTDWRMGNNEASTWSLQMPIVVGDAVLAPGQYRISLVRSDQTHCALVAHGSHLALGKGSDVQVTGELGKAARPAKKLVVEWEKGPGSAAANQPAQIVVQYGDNEWKGPLTLVGGKNAALPGWKVTVFTLPAAAVEARDRTPVPVAVFSRGKDKAAENWNLVLGKDDARLVPWMVAPTDSYGFGETKAPEPAAIVTGKVEAQDAEHAVELLELKDSSLQKGEFALQLAAGKQTLKVTVPEPKAKAR